MKEYLNKGNILLHLESKEESVKMWEEEILNDIENTEGE